MDKRIQGTEHEYTYYSRHLSERNIDPHTLGLEIIYNSDLHDVGEFLINQSRAYFDVGHLEISTCEVSNFMDLVIWEKAGEKIVDWARKEIEDRYLSTEKKVWAFKNNTAPDGTSYGSHENYLIKRDVSFPNELLKKLVPHLITRFIYTGAGDILDGRYVLSPCAYLTSMLISPHTMHNTGVINTRDEPHGNPSRFRRLHVIIGDAVLSEYAIALRQFTTSAIIHLIEEGKLDDIPNLTSPLEDMWHNVEETNPDKWVIHIKDKKSNPIEIQRYYVEKVEEIVVDDDEKDMLRIWEDLLNALERKDSKYCARKIEWVDRYFAIAEYKEKYPDEEEIEMQICKRYSEICESRSIHYMRNRKGLIDNLIDKNKVKNAIFNPPEDTRAKYRHEICKNYDVVRIDWSFAIIKDDGKMRRIDMDDPFYMGGE